MHRSCPQCGQPASDPVACSWSASWPVVTAELVSVALLALLGWLATEPTGSLLAAIAAVLLAVAASQDAVLRPTLTADRTGIVVRRGRRLHRIEWVRVGRLAGSSTGRRLTLIRTLEIDVGDELVVLPARRLGADPTEVAQALEQMRR